MPDFESRVLRDLGVLKAQMEQVMGIGQPGRLHALETRVEAHERSVQRLKGMGGAFGVALALVHVVIAWWVGRR